MFGRARVNPFKYISISFKISTKKDGFAKLFHNLKYIFCNQLWYQCMILKFYIYRQILVVLTSSTVLTSVDNPRQSDRPSKPMKWFVYYVLCVVKEDGWRIEHFPRSVNYTQPCYYGDNPSKSSNQLVIFMRIFVTILQDFCQKWIIYQQKYANPRSY